MTQNYKPDELPGSIDDIPASTAPLVIDQYLSRQAVIDAIDDHTPASITGAGRRHLSRSDMAALARQHGDQDLDVDGSKHDIQKADLIRALADIFDFHVSPDQDTLRKSQMVHVLLVLATDWTPRPFTLPSDPDDHGAEQPDVPTLEEANAGAD